MIQMTFTIDSAVQTNAAPGDGLYCFGPACYWQDKANFPKGTPQDGLLNVIRKRGMNGVVVARVSSRADAVTAIEADSGRKVVFVSSKPDRRESRAEGRAS